MLHFFIQLLDELSPVFQADLEDFAVVYLRYTYEIEMGVVQIITSGKIFNELANISDGISSKRIELTLRCIEK